MLGSLYKSQKLLFFGSANNAATRYMGGGKKFRLYPRTLHKNEKHRHILRLCDEMLGAGESHRPARWRPLETLLHHRNFINWTKPETFIEAFSKSNDRYLMRKKGGTKQIEICLNVHHPKVVEMRRQNQQQDHSKNTSLGETIKVNPDRRNFHGS